MFLQYSGQLELLRLNELISGRSPGVGIGSEVKASASIVGDPGSIPGSGRYPWEGNGISHSSILAWRIPWTEKPGRLQSTGSQRAGHDSLHFSILAWEIPWMEEPAGLQAIGSQRVGRNWVHAHTHKHKHLEQCLAYATLTMKQMLTNVILIPLIKNFTFGNLPEETVWKVENHLFPKMFIT